MDTHWIGGDPGKNEVYGWASWNPRKGIIVLRNPDDQPANFTADAARLFELPSGAPGKFVMRSPWKKDGRKPTVTLESGKPTTFALKPFEVLVLEETNAK